MQSPKLIPFPGLTPASDNGGESCQRDADVTENLTRILHALAQSIPPGRSHSAPAVNLIDTANRFLVSKASRGCRPRYLVQLRSSLSQFCDRFGHRSLADITPADVRDYLARPSWSGKTRLNYWIDLKNFFNFCLRDELLSRNPVASVDRPLVDRSLPAVHAPAIVRAYLQTAMAIDPPLANYFARAYFLGLRPSENDRLQPSDVGGASVIVSAASKTRKRRPVPLSDNLRAWLDASPFETPIVNFRRRWEHLKQQSGVTWSHDVTRNTFCSCALALHGATKAARWAGHSEDVMFSSYAEIVSESDAKAFFEIRPGKVCQCGLGLTKAKLSRREHDNSLNNETRTAKSGPPGWLQCFGVPTDYLK